MKKTLIRTPLIRLHPRCTPASRLPHLTCICVLASIPIVPHAARTASNCSASSTPSTLTHPPPFRIRNASGPPSYNTKQSRGRLCRTIQWNAARVSACCAMCARLEPIVSVSAYRTACSQECGATTTRRSAQQHNTDEKESGCSDQLRPTVSKKMACPRHAVWPPLYCGKYT